MFNVCNFNVSKHFFMNMKFDVYFWENKISLDKYSYLNHLEDKLFISLAWYVYARQSLFKIEENLSIVILKIDY